MTQAQRFQDSFVIQVPGMQKTERSRIAILTTGGTIAGEGQSQTGGAYTSAKLGVQQLLEAVPELHDVADITGEEVVSIGSQDMSDEVWLTLAKRINAVLAQDDIDGIVITHGTDTMEETAWFLHLTVHSNKPVVLTGAMRPATARSADGPLNLYNAAVTAASPEAVDRGVMVVMNDTVFGARDVTKMHTSGVDTFQAPNFGPLGYVHDGIVTFQRRPEMHHTMTSEFDVSGLDKLPQVGIVFGYSNCSPLPVNAYVGAGYQGIVHAGLGNGNIHCDVLDALVNASRDGVRVVRSSRANSGSTTMAGEVDDEQYGFIASLHLNPQKARVLLQLALTKTTDRDAIQNYFLTY
ncbi:L-asparaginase 2 [Kistimonas scapharcae]